VDAVLLDRLRSRCAPRHGVILEAEEQLTVIEKYGGIEAIGGFHTASHYAAAWAHASNTPFQ
jgi:arylsulfatase